MKRISLYSIFAVFMFSLIFAPYSHGQNDALQRTIARFDLTKATSQHRLQVEIEPPQISSETIRYFMPKIVPGTYTINNFGRFVHDMKAYDQEGSELNIARIDTNTWEISGASRLKRISYWVEDTYHSQSMPVVFEPTGTCIDSAEVFMLNNFTLIGYFEGFKDMPYTISITKPQGFYGATSMPLESSGPDTDVYNPRNYFELHDNPIMYSIPDTASVMVNNTKILLSLYSPNKKVNAAYLIEHTKQLFEAQGEYLGGELPASKYSILVYLFEGSSLSGSAGALEHFSSTTFTYPEISGEEFIQPFRDVVAHEFFHIVTPLGIHSDEIGNFDFINPVMSKHLWLYEGSTEYYAVHSQVKHGVITPDEFFKKLQQKLYISTLYLNDTLPFTELSKGALDKYKPQYFNVYQKGALINMCLDLYLLKLSEGKYGLQQLKTELGNKYGPDRSFNDSELFDIITGMTFPEIREFFAKYVEGPNRLPYKQFLNYAGYDFFDEYELEVPALIGAALQLGEEGSIEVAEVNDFGKLLKLKEGDRIFSINGSVVNAHNFENIAGGIEKKLKPGDEVTIVVERKSKGSNYIKKTLKANTYPTKRKERFVILAAKDATDEQLMIRKAWIDQ
ncbi:MAG TPA: peptidase M61 [Ignavibacteria bacterium]|nr:peptidase M61 [Ignavibacteria bacterium]HRJ05330.1 peptidase M61 [Ignavibacteria bacterium]